MLHGGDRIARAAGVVMLTACAAAPPVVRVEPAAAPAPPPLFDAGLEARLDSIVTAAIADSTAPGVAIAVGRHGRVAVLKGYGRTDWTESAQAVTAETIYDLASLTKVIASTTAAMLLEEDRRLDLDRPIASYLPEFDSPEKAAITVRLLLTHRAGFEAFAPLSRESSGREQYLSQINARPLHYEPGARAIYSDWSPIILQLVMERITGQPLDVFTRDRIFTPLGMSSTMFRPPDTVLMRVAPTEIRPSASVPLHGTVHDENAEAIGGVSGHAGLFGSAADLAVFAQMMLNGGYHGGTWLLRPETIARWTARRERDASRAYGWDTPSPGSSAGRYFSPRSFGHTGFTGTSMWIDPQKNLYVIVLTNAVNPTRRHTRHFRLRRDIADAVQSAVTDQPLMQWEP